MNYNRIISFACVVLLFYVQAGLCQLSLDISFIEGEKAIKVFEYKSYEKTGDFIFVDSSNSVILSGDLEIDRANNISILEFRNIREEGEYTSKIKLEGDSILDLNIKTRFENPLEFDSDIKTVEYNLRSKDELSLFINNKSIETIKLKSIDARLTLNDQKYYSSNVNCNFIDNNMILNQGINQIPIDIKASNFSAGKFEGKIIIQDERNNKHMIPCILYAKHYFLYALILSILGVIIGYYLKFYNNNKLRYELIEDSDELLLLVEQLDSNQKVEELKEEIVSFLKKLNGNKYRKRNHPNYQIEYNAFVVIFNKLKNTQKSRSTDSININTDLGQRSFQKRFRTIGRILIITSLFISMLLVFNQLYILDPDFGSIIINDYVKLFLAMVVVGKTGQLIFDSFEYVIPIPLKK
ncbi:hypothetical protein N9231_02575 [Saprospiraceae bacterium]|nr:hypothetical protein [Saprospiraceae bacterium]